MMKAYVPKHTKLKNMRGEVVPDNQGADTLADYFEQGVAELVALAGDSVKPVAKKRAAKKPAAKKRSTSKTAAKKSAAKKSTAEVSAAKRSAARTRSTKARTDR